jgi:hypothetical protein
MSWWGSSFAALVLAMLLITAAVPTAEAESAIVLGFPPSVESGSENVYRVDLMNEGDVDIIVLEVMADVQGADWKFPFGSDIIHFFNGSRSVPSGTNTSFEKEQFAWAVTGLLEVEVTVRYTEVGGTEELVVNQTFTVMFYLDYDESPYEDRKEPNLLAIFFLTFILFWGALMLGFYIRRSYYDFEIKKTLELETIDGTQWFKWFDQIWWAKGRKMLVLLFYGIFALLFALMITFGYRW